MTLDGSDGSDPDGVTLTFDWTQTAGTTVTPNEVDANALSFVAPDEDETLTFKLNVEDEMAIYVGLLRAVNVGGNILKMSRLRELFEELGFGGVRTYLQSGNVVFESKFSASTVVRSVEQRLAGETRLPVTVFIRTPEQLRDVLKRNPFAEPNSSPRRPPKSQRKEATSTSTGRVRLYVAFLATVPATEGVKQLMAFDAGKDRLHLAGTEVYVDFAEGAGKSKLINAVLEKLLVTRATTRNWNTVSALYEMAKQA